MTNLRSLCRCFCCRSWSPTRATLEISHCVRSFFHLRLPCLYSCTVCMTLICFALCYGFFFYNVLSCIKESFFIKLFRVLLIWLLKNQCHPYNAGNRVLFNEKIDWLVEFVCNQLHSLNARNVCIPFENTSSGKPKLTFKFHYGNASFFTGFLYLLVYLQILTSFL